MTWSPCEELPDGCMRDVWERLTSEYDLDRIPVKKNLV